MGKNIDFAGVNRGGDSRTGGLVVLIGVAGQDASAFLDGDLEALAD